MDNKKNHHPTPEMREEAISLLIRGWSHRRIATKIGVSHTKIFVWAKEPDVVARIAEARAAHLQAADRIYSAEVVRLVRMEIDIALGKKRATPAQVQALHRALTRAGVGEPERLQLSGSLSGASDAEIDAALREWLAGAPEEDQGADPVTH